MMLSCNSTNASIWGLAVSWKNVPQGLGESQLIKMLEKIIN